MKLLEDFIIGIKVTVHLFVNFSHISVSLETVVGFCNKSIPKQYKATKPETCESQTKTRTIKLNDLAPFLMPKISRPGYCDCKSLSKSRKQK